MRIQITTRHGHLPTPVRTRAETIVGKLTKFEPRVSAADIIFDESKTTHRAEVILHIDGAEPVVAHAEEKDFRAALDKTVERVSRILKKNRERRRDHTAQPLSDGK